MIVVTIELWPYGFSTNKKILGRGIIFNDGTGDQKVGNYGFKLWGKRNAVWKEGAVTKFPRLRRNAWDLLYRCLREGIAGRNK